MRYLNAFLVLLLTLPALNGGQEMSSPAMKTVHVTGPTLDLKKLGARGDGVHNDSAVFRAAAEIIQKAGGGRLIIPSGTYIVGEQIHEDGKFPYYQAQPVFLVKKLDGLVIEGRGATIRLAPGLRFGSFDKLTGEPIQPKKGGFTDRAYAAAACSMLDIRDSRNIRIHNLELDGNSGALILGGYWGDVGRQLHAYGIELYNNSDVVVENVHTHHHGLDGILVGWSGLKESDPPTPHTLINVVSEYNARQGLSWVGGRGLRAYRCKFNHTARGAFGSAPAAGLDIEAEGSVCRDGYFEDCEFLNNGGCAMVADSGDGGYTRFVRCMFWGVSNWSTWSQKPGLVYEDCKIYGSAVHGYGSTNAVLATRYVRCQFEDKDYGTNGVYRSAAVIECSSRGDNITYEDCAITANKTRSFWFDSGNGRKYVRGCRVLHRNERANGDFVALFRGVHIENTRFEEDYPPNTTARYRIEAQNVTVGSNVFVAGPCVRWGGRTGPVSATSGYQQPIDWSQLRRCDRTQPRPRELDDCARILLNSARHNLAWATNAIAKLDGRLPLAGKEDVNGRGAHDFIRPICNVAFGLAVLLKTGLFDPQELGCPTEEARARAVRLIAGAAGYHRGQSWGYAWQSALWAAYLGHASWLLWDELDAAQRALVTGVVEKEADRFLNYPVPYWNGKGGDTKAEENAWNSMVLSVAVAMMHRHPHAPAWREKCSELMISAYATQADMQSERRVDGRPLKQWLRGFNANPDGSVVNHGFLHPDYILCVHLNLRAFVVQPLARQAVPEAARFNADLVYRCLVTRQWPSPPYAVPGGTIYRPGEPFLYYPEKADWGRVHCETAYLVDAHAHVLGLDKGLPHRAQDWMRLRASKILEMQSRHADRRIWADGEFDTWPGREQTAFGRLAAAFLALWLDAQRFPVRTANWLAVP